MMRGKGRSTVQIPMKVSNKLAPPQKKMQERRRAAGEHLPEKDLRPVPPSLSRSAIHYPFSTNAFLREDYRNPGALIRVRRRAALPALQGARAALEVARAALEVAERVGDAARRRGSGSG